MSRSVSAALQAPGRLEFARNAPLDVLVWRAQGTTREWTCVHRTLTVILFDDFSADLWYRGSIARIQPGDLGVFEAGRVTRCWNQVARGDYRFIEFPPGFLGDGEMGFPTAPGFARPIVRDRSLWSAADALFTTVDRAGDDVGDCMAAMRRALDASGAAGGGSPDADSPVLQRVREHIDANLARNLPIEDLAAVADMSRFAFVRAWKREIGLPPHAYVVHRRVMAARRRLCDGVPIAAVADECGFHDQSHLHRHFKRITGITPGVFQRGLRIDC